jgi:hypothetical protein
MTQPRLSHLEPRTSMVLQLKPEQAAWIKAHAGRRGVSAFMRHLLEQMMEDELREIARLRRGLVLARAHAEDCRRLGISD